MFITLPKDKLESFLKEELECWRTIGGGVNPDAHEFDPQTVDPKKLEKLGYYTNRESWIAGARVKTLEQFLNDLKNYPVSKIG